VPLSLWSVGKQSGLRVLLEAEHFATSVGVYSRKGVTSEICIFIPKIQLR
jgi:hypothetical protein